MRARWVLGIAATAALFVAAAVAGRGRNDRLYADEGAKAGPPAVSAEAERGLEWLAAAQNENGGFGEDARTEPDVATTSLVALAFIRSGHTPTEGKYREVVARAVEYVRAHVAGSPDEGIQVKTRQGTQPQRKLGPNIDTFLAAQLLARARGEMPDVEANGAVDAALAKCVGKIEKGQQQDGGWTQGGWAPILETTFAAIGLEAARERGVVVDARVEQKAQEYVARQYDPASGEIRADEGAGVKLYAAATSLRIATTGAGGGSTGSPSEPVAKARDAAERELASEDTLRGFGSMGGEEFVSYMMTSDSLKRAGKPEAFDAWNAKIKDRVAKIQNADGTWAGHHCITSKTFCTAAAVMTLTAEREQVPAAQAM